MENLSVIITLCGLSALHAGHRLAFLQTQRIALRLSDRRPSAQQMGGGMSAQASDMSGWLLLGLPGYAYLQGMEAAWIAIGLAAGTYLNWRFVARRLRRYTEIAGNAITLPDYFANRFNDHNRLLRVLSAVLYSGLFPDLHRLRLCGRGKAVRIGLRPALPQRTAHRRGRHHCLHRARRLHGGQLDRFFSGHHHVLRHHHRPLLALHATGGFAETLDRHVCRQIDTGYLSLFTDASGQPLTSLAIVSLMAWGWAISASPTS